MGNDFFQFKKFKIEQSRCAMKVTTDACLFGAWAATLMHDPKTILDIGAGTGLLGLILSQNCSANVDLIEIEEECYVQLKQNIENSNWSERINPIHNDIREMNPEKYYDVIISNPPFYENQLLSENNNLNLARHSHQLKLTELLGSVIKLLDEKGTFFILLPAYRLNECIGLAETMHLYPCDITFVKQTPLHSNFRVMISFLKKKNQISEQTICIRNADNTYTTVFKSLLSPYYLQL